jgi:acyl-CoA reductase-like NAD-dependent aldehyde dehydrogenase
MSTTLTDPSIYPIAEETARQLSRPLFGHVIDGAVVPSIDGATMPVIDPATERQVALAAAGSAADVERAAASARAAFDDGRWWRLPPLEKERRLRNLARLLAERAETFAEIDVIDSGLLKWYEGFIVQFAVDGIDYYAGWPTKIEGSIPAVPTDFSVYQQREPIGVIGLITPWNGPTSVFAFVAAALAAGNSVVLKPAEQTPMAAVLMAELALEAGIPPGVFNVVQGTGPDAGAPLVTSANVDAVSFTGSVATGQAIQVAAATRLKRVSLELGGKSPLIVFPDADLESAAATAMAAVWGATGQVCTVASRLLVHRSVHDKLVERIVEASRDLRLGSGFDPRSQMGPLVSAAQLERVQRYVGYGQEDGAELVLGGQRHGDVGYFHEPTVFTSVRNDMRIAQEEIFGPVMSILPFESEEEAYAIANDTTYGLAAGVWTNNLSQAHRASRALRAGTVWINTYQMVYPTVPYGGVKHSGHGRNLGAASLDDLTQIKSVWMKVDG